MYKRQIWLYTGYVGESTPYEVTNYAMGTYVQQTVYGKNGQAGASAAANAISSLENEISWRVDGSEIQKLNEQAGGDPVKVSKDTFSILQASLDAVSYTHLSALSPVTSLIILAISCVPN